MGQGLQNSGAKPTRLTLKMLSQNNKQKQIVQQQTMQNLQSSQKKPLPQT